MELKKDVLEHAIADAKIGKQSAYSFLLNTYWGKVYGFLLKRTKEEYLAEEITIQTFSRAFENLEKYDNNYSFATWLTTISKNLHIDLMRRDKKKDNNGYKPKDQKLERVPDENPTPEDALIKKQSRIELLDYVKMLKPQFRDVIYQRYFEEQSYKEMAEDLNEPMSNVKIRLIRARRLLAQLIQTNN